MKIKLLVELVKQQQNMRIGITYKVLIIKLLLI